MKPSRPKALISWSSGKDSAFALHDIRRSDEFDVVGALTTVTETFERVSIHGVRQEILLAQLDAAGLPPRIVPIPYPCPNEIYEARMGEAVAQAVRDGITHIIFGDLYLADIRAYREAEARGHRDYAGVSTVATADAATGACDDRQAGSRPGSPPSI